MKTENSTSTIDNTIFESCINKLLNELNLQDGTALGVLESLCEKGLAERCRDITPEYQARLAHEIDIINKKGMIWGFLIIWDFIKFARSKNIMISPGCGALPGSLVAYSLGITKVDPIKNKLLFERFLNSESQSSTYGIRIDVEKGAKAQILDYISEKYGSEMPKILEMADIEINECIDLSIIKETVKIIWQNWCIDIDISSIDLNDTEVYDYFSEKARYGVFCFDENYEAMTYAYIFHDVINISDNRKLWNEYLVPLVYRSNALFKRIEPNSFNEFAAAMSLDRPGTEKCIEKYKINKNNPDKIIYECPELESILSETYGCVIYQEQVMKILQEMAGFSPVQSNKCRRALSKREIEKIKEYRIRFVNGNQEENIPGCISNGISETVAKAVFDCLYLDAPYSFNKAHAICYSRMVYTMVWLKYYFESEFQEAIDIWRNMENN